MAADQALLQSVNPLQIIFIGGDGRCFRVGLGWQQAPADGCHVDRPKNHDRQTDRRKIQQAEARQTLLAQNPTDQDVGGGQQRGHAAQDGAKGQRYQQAGGGNAGFAGSA